MYKSECFQILYTDLKCSKTQNIFAIIPPCILTNMYLYYGVGRRIADLHFIYIDYEILY